MKTYQFWQCYVAIVLGVAGAATDQWGFAVGAFATCFLIVADALIEAIKEKGKQ